MNSPIFKLILFIVFIFPFSGYGQIEKGTWMAGGDGSFRTYTREVLETGKKSRSSYLELSPNLGYFILDKFVVGARSTFYYQPYEGAYNIGYGIGPFVKYYFLKPDNLINIFTEASYSYDELHNNNGVIHSKSPVRTLQLGVGTVLFFNDSVGLELALKYRTSDRNSITRENGVQINLGFQVHLKN